MKKTLLISALIICFCLFLLSFSKAGSSFFLAKASYVKKERKDSIGIAAAMNADSVLSESVFDSNHLGDLGLSKEALLYAIKGYEKLIREGVIDNPQYLSIVDLSQSSRKKRFYLLDVMNRQLVMNTFVAHGRKSGIDEAQSFSNDPNSNESSLGFYKTEQTYSGKHGLSLRLSGLEDGFNNNAESRGIVVHAADYVNENRVNSTYMGRSQGCPALPKAVAPKVINMIKGGSVLFVYHPSPEYLQYSTILNG